MILSNKCKKFSPFFVVSFIFVLIFSFSINKVVADPGTYYVNINTGSNANNGSQSAPFKTITYALTQVSADDTISVAAGVYNAANGETFPLTINKNNITLQGADSATTIISAPESVDAIVFDNVTGGTLFGFTIQDTPANQNSVVINNGSSEITISQNIFTDIDGVAISNYQGGENITIQNNKFFSVKTGINFGINDNSGHIISNNLIYDTTDHCFVFRRTADTTITNNTLYDCGVDGLVFAQNSNIIVKNNIIYNSGEEDLDVVDDADSAIENSYNLLTNSSNSYSGDITAGLGEIYFNPSFVNPDNGDFSLRETSPAIDAGDPSSECASEPETSSCIIDLGAYGNTSSATVGAAISEIYVDANSGSDSTGDGSATKPYKTLNRALGRVRYQDGDTIYASGTFTEQVYLPVQRSGKKGSPTTISLWPEDFTSTTIDATNQDYGFYIWGASYVTLDEDLLVQNASRDGIYVKESDNITVNGVEISNNSGNGVLFESSDNITITNSEIADNADAGIHFVSSSGATVAGNWLGNNALALEQNSPNAILVNNFIFNSTVPGIYVSDSYPVTIKNNTISNIEYSSLSLSGSETAPEADIKNNIIYVPAGDYYALEIGENITGTTNFNFDYNNYYLAGEGSKLSSVTSGETLASWQENYNVDLNSISADPIFTDAENFDFHLEETSPSIDVGDPDDDYSLEPEPNGNRIDQGAYGNTSGATSGVNAVDVGEEDDVDNDSITDEDDNVIYEKEDETDRFETKSLSAENTWINKVNVSDESARFVQVEGEEDGILFAGPMNILGKYAKGIKKVQVRIKHKSDVLDAAKVKVQKKKWQHSVRDIFLEKGEEYKVQAKDAAGEGDFTKLAGAIQTNPAPTMVNYNEPVIVVPQTHELKFSGLVQPNLDSTVFVLTKSDDLDDIYKCQTTIPNNIAGTQSVFCSFGQNVPVGEYNLGFQSIENYNDRSLPSVAQKKLLFISQALDAGGVLNTDSRNSLFNNRVTSSGQIKLVGIGPQNYLVRVYLANIEGSDFYGDRLNNLQLLAEGEYVSEVGWQAEISLNSLNRGNAYLLVIDFYDSQTEKLKSEDRILYPIFFAQKVVKPIVNIAASAQYFQNDKVVATLTSGADYHYEINATSKTIASGILTPISAVQGKTDFILSTSKLGTQKLEVTVEDPNSGLTAALDLSYQILAVTPESSENIVGEEKDDGIVVKEENKPKNEPDLPKKEVKEILTPLISVQREVRDAATDKILQTLNLPHEQQLVLKVITIKGFPETTWLPWRREKSVDIITFSGETAPNAEVILTIRSEPIVRITRADKEGKWTISVRAEDLPEGEHITYLQTSLDGVRSEEIEIAKFVVKREEHLSNTSIVFIVNALLIAFVLIFVAFYQMRRKMLPIPETPLKEESLSSVKPIFSSDEDDKSPPSPPPPPQQGVLDI